MVESAVTFSIENPEKTVFFRLIPESRLPVPADNSAAGTMPTVAFKYCEPMRTASGMGWYIFSPIDFDILFDGVCLYWRLNSEDRWERLEAAQFPNFATSFDQSCPEDLRGYSPPLLGCSASEPDMVQIWSGLIARTPPEWCLLLRSPPNLPQRENYVCFEGVIETDRWFGPLFMNLKITKPDVAVHFRRDWPFFCAQLMPRALCSQKLYREYSTIDRIEDLTEEDWNGYRRTVVNRVNNPLERGGYAKETRKRRKTLDKITR